MTGKFIMAGDGQLTTLDWGQVGWLSNPSITGAAQLAIVEADFFPGKGHNFHRHPEQEEVIFVVAGKIEQWIDRDHRILGPGDTAFIPPDVVHASFNVGDGTAKILAIFGPCVGEGSTVVEMAGEAPWSTMRS